MSLGIVIKSTEGLILAADSRVTVMAQGQVPIQGVAATQVMPVTFDNARKLLTFREPNNFVAAVTYGVAAIGTQPNDLRTAHGFLSEFEATSEVGKGRLAVKDFAKELGKFYLAEWNKAGMPSNVPGNAGMVFIVAGFDDDKPYGRVFQIIIPSSPEPVELMADQFGINFGGQGQTAARILSGIDPAVPSIINQANIPPQEKLQIITQLGALHAPIPVALLALQDCIDLATLLVDTTIAVQDLSIGIRGVGGATDVLVITKLNGAAFVQQKILSAEKRL